MDGIVWLVCSWVVVGLLSYIFVTRTGIAPGQTQENVNIRRVSQLQNSERSDWVNEVIAWLSTYKSFPIGLSEHWIRALNQVAKKICVPSQNEVIFEESQSMTNATYFPKISNLESSRNANGQLVVKGHLDVPATVLRVVASENVNNYSTITNYNANITNLIGEIEVRLASIADETYLMCCWANIPEMTISLTNADKPNELVDFNPKLDNTIRKCLTSAVMSINFHEYVASLRDESLIGKSNYFTDNYSSYNDNLAPSTPSSNHQYDRSLFVYPSHQQQQTQPQQKQIPNKIRIKLLKAQRLNFEDRANIKPYVKVEIDEPPQVFTSNPSHTVNPHFDQNAEFVINELSDEVLFEVYGLTDNVAEKNKFLGLAIAGLSEMRNSKETVHTLQLQSNPERKERVTGTLTIQSQFFHDPFAQVNNKKPADLHNKQTTFAFNDQYSQKPQASNAYDYQTKQNNYTGIKNEPNQYYNEGHSVLDNVTNKGVDFTELVDRPHKEPLTNQQQTAQSTKQISYQMSTYASADENEPPPQWIELENAQLISNADTDASDNERGRSARKSRSGKRERSFFGELRDRLTGGHSKAKKRAKSLDAQNPLLDEAPSEPPSRDQSQVRYGQLSRTGTLERSTTRTRSPASDIPNAASKLVLELGDDYQEKKYYFIPDFIEEQLRATRIMKRGKKLHICNDHSFVAVKTKGSVNCDVCGNKISTNFSKQAYQCRDCRLVTHKHCHRKSAQTPCPNSTLNEKFIVEDVNWEQLLNRFQDGQEEEFISGENL